MSEIITNIREVHDIKQGATGIGGGISNVLSALSGYGTYDGYEITTTEQTIYVLIDNQQSCCENWGYLASDDNLEQFIGALLLDMSVVDEGLNTRMVSAGEYIDEGGIVFVSFSTDFGVLQLACYNGHNGYYGHEVHILSNQVAIAAGV